MEERHSLEVGSQWRIATCFGALSRPFNRNGAGGRRDTVTKAFCRSLSTDWVNRRHIACDLEGRCSDEAVTEDAGLVAWSRRPDIWGAPVGIVSPDGGGARDASTFVELRWRVCVVTG